MKQMTVLVTLDNDVDIYDDAAQQGLCDGITTMESVKSAQIVGVSEGLDPEEA